MNILLVYPKYPETYWSFHYALKFVSKKASFPPLGLLTVAAMLPEEWNKKLIDLNVTDLREKDIKWADYVFVSAMVVQKESAKNIIQKCRNAGVKTVCGGPLFTTEYEDFNQVDYLVLNEAEITLPMFINDLKLRKAKHIYKSSQWADIKTTPVPLWEIIDMKKYASMNIQYSRGCPFSCDFCNITMLYGRFPRTKDTNQILQELESLYEKGWRGSVFFVDDNFIGNKIKLKKEVLPAIIQWMDNRKHPFTFFTEASVDLSDDMELMELMVRAGFDKVFVGIETPNEESLTECNKFQNKNRDLMECIKKIQKFGLEVQGGFIVGFDSDPHYIFERLISFIQESGIVTAMVGLLNAPRGTKLYQRLAEEGRLLKDMSGDNTDFSINFVPKMNYELLIEGYRKIINTIYSPKYYYERVKKFLSDYTPLQKHKFHIKLSDIMALNRSLIILGVFSKERRYYWKLILWSLFRRPEVFTLAVTYMIYGFHFRKVYENY